MNSSDFGLLLIIAICLAGLLLADILFKMGAIQ
jgi:hypothetical protein